MWLGLSQKRNLWLHKKLRKLEDYCEWARDRNLNENQIIKTVALVFNSSSRFNEVFWWINLIEWEIIDVPDDAAMRRRAQFC